MSIIHTTALSPEWFATRRSGITGTDLPKILGLSKYGNTLSVWLDKRGELRTDEAGEAARWGQIMEEPVAVEWATREGVAVVPTGIWRNDTTPWQLASPDRLVKGCAADASGRGCYLEVKTRNAFTAGQWRSDMPDDVLAQVAWTSLVMDVDHAHVATLIGGQRLETFVYDRDSVLESYLVAAAQGVWDDVQTGMRPHPDADPGGVLLAVLNAETGPREGEVEVDGDTVAALVAEYRDAAAAAAGAEARKKVAQTELVRLLGEGPGAAHTALVQGAAVFTYKTPSAGTTFPAPQLKRLAKVDHDTYTRLREGGFITATAPAPRFSLKETTS